MLMHLVLVVEPCMVRLRVLPEMQGKGLGRRGITFEGHQDPLINVLGHERPVLLLHGFFRDIT